MKYKTISAVEAKELGFGKSEWREISGRGTWKISTEQSCSWLDLGMFEYRVEVPELSDYQRRKDDMINAYYKQINTIAVGEYGGIDDFVWEFRYLNEDFWCEENPPSDRWMFQMSNEWKFTAKPTTIINGKMITKEKASKLFEETRDTHDWFSVLTEQKIKSMLFVSDGYTFKPKEFVMLDNEEMSAEDANKKYQECKATHSLWFTSLNGDWIDFEKYSGADRKIDILSTDGKYELRKKIIEIPLGDWVIRYKLIID